MHYEFNYEISDALVRAGMRRFVRHALGWRLPVLAVVTFLLLIPLCRSDASGYLCGLGAGTLVLLLLVIAGVFVQRQRNTMSLARKLATRAARCAITDDGLDLENAAARSFLKWPLFDKIVRASDVWLLFIGRQTYFVLPAEKLAGAPGEFIAARVVAGGGKVL